MERLGFCDVWINWIMACVTLVLYRVVVSGPPSREFLPSRGFRQGDAISPYLFILVSDTLSSLLSKALDDKRLQG